MVDVRYRRSGAMLTVAAMAAGFAAVAVPAQGAVVAGAPVIINEVYGGGGNSGATLKRDFVELYNPSSTAVDLSGWAVQYASAAGSTWQTTPLTGSIAAGGSLLIGEAFGTGGSQDVTVDISGSIPMSGTGAKVALTSTTAALSCSTGCSTVASVVDLVGWGTSASSYAGSGPAPATTNSTSIERVGSHTSTANNATDFAAGTPTPTPAGPAPTPDPTPTPTPTPTDPTSPVTAIAAIQGSGASSPLVGQTVTTEGVVTATYPSGGLNGYVIQTAGSGGAVTGRTASDGLFVFSPSTAASVAVGDTVRVTGAVSEYQGLTELSVTSAAGLERLGTGATVPALTGSWPSTDAEREAAESMLYLPSGQLTVSNTYSTNQYGTVGLAAGTTPLLQPTDVARPGSAAAAAVVADNAARAVVLDDGATTNYLSSANSSLVPPYVSLTAPVRVGAAATFTAPVVVDYRYNAWTLNPRTALAGGAAAPVAFSNTRTAAPDAAAIGDGDLRVASFNVLNYFTTLGSSDPSCTPYRDRSGDGVTVNTGCDLRGAWDAADLARQQSKIVAAINALDADVVGLMEIENSAVVDGVADEAVGTLVAALNAAAGAGTWAFVPSSAELPATSSQDAITNAIIYRTAAVTRTGDSRALGTESDAGEAFANAREPIGQVFTPVGGGEPFLVVVNHLKSKGSAGPWPGDADAGDGQGSSNESRVRQAQALAAWVPTVVDPDEAVVLLGDFNAYTHEDPMQVLADAGYTDAASTLASNQYSYSFSGLSGSLDHVLLNSAAKERATGADIWEINAEESIALEYSRYNYHGALYHAADPYRSSDHDPVIVGLAAGASDAPVDLTFLDINDFHGRIDSNTVLFAGTVEAQRAAAEAAGGSVAFLSAGDNIGASLFASASAGDQPTIDVLNALDLQASAVGNHEFDRGFADLTDRVINGGANAEFAYLGANVVSTATGQPALPAYTLLDMDGVTVGVVGAVTQETPALVSPAGVAGLTFTDPVAAVNTTAAALTDGDPANGEADVIVALYHDGASAGTPDGASLSQEIAAGGTFARIVTETAPAVDVIFTGHTHKQYAWTWQTAAGAQRPVLQTGSYGENIGKVALTYDPATDLVSDVTVANVPRLAVPTGTTAAAYQATLAATYPRVAAVKTIVDAAIAAATVVGNVPVGSVTADITTAYTGGSYTGPGGTYVPADPTKPSGGRDDRAKESALGGLVADSLLATLADPLRGGAQIGVVNPGGLRNELFYAPDGTVTYAEANAILPFVNNLWTTTLTGAQFTTLLEQQWQTNPDGTIPSRPYLQLGLSENVTYTYDASRPLGSHITSVTINGAPLDPAASYRIGTFSFLAQGGDNFRVMAAGTQTADSGLIDRDAWIDYITAHPGLTPDFARQAVGVPAIEAVNPGGRLTFPVTGLDLTSLGAPANTAVTVAIDGTTIGTAAVSGGSATVDLTVPATTAAGSHTLTVTAAPSGTTVTVPLSVTKAASSTALALSTGAVTAGSSAKVTATVTVSGPVAPTGSVELWSGTTRLGTAALSGGKASVTVPALAVGSYQLTARYLGSAALLPSESGPAAFVVNAKPSAVTLYASQSKVRQHALLPVLLIADVDVKGQLLPAGTVEFREGNRVVGTSRVLLGLGAIALPRGMSLGVHHYTAVYVPADPTVARSTSAVVSVTVTR